MRCNTEKKYKVPGNPCKKQPPPLPTGDGLTVGMIPDAGLNLPNLVVVCVGSKWKSEAFLAKSLPM